MIPRFTLITPTLARSTLPRACHSVDRQTFKDWEHLIAIDLPSSQLENRWNHLMMAAGDARRRFLFCDRQHADYGHTCRHELSKMARGKYLLYLDDDDYLADDRVLETLSTVTTAWAVFPVLREGHVLFSPQPARGSTTLSSFIHQRALGPFPKPKLGYTDEQVYQVDADLVERLAALAEPLVLANERPLIVIPVVNRGSLEVE